MRTKHVQTKSEIRQALQQAGIRPRKRFGQHFLIDGNLMRLLVQSADLRPNDRVLEVGAGTGGLTDLLLNCVGDVLAVEIDYDLFAYLSQRFASTPSLTLLRSDALDSKHRLASELSTWITSPASRSAQACKLVANLPYQIATPLIMNLLVDYPQMQTLCFTVQAEVGSRLTALSGSKAFGPLAIITQCLAQVEIIKHLPPEVFWPQPSVRSTMIRLTLIEARISGRKNVHHFAEMVRLTFEHRRKTLRTALKYVLSQEQHRRVIQHVDCSRRPESLDVEEWLSLFDVVSAG